jgi:putative sterol carrier protein
VTDLDLSAYADLNPAQFAALVKSTPRQRLEAVIDGPHRGDLLAAIFHRMPGLFRAEAAASVSATIRWNITAASDSAASNSAASNSVLASAEPAVWSVVIADGACSVSDDPSLAPKVSLTMGGYTFLQLVSGNANPAMLVLTGKVKVNGDIATAAGIAKYFDLPKG